MKGTFRAVVLAVIAAFAASGATAASYTIDWTGTGGYSMTGAFSFDDSQLTNTLVTESDLTSFEIQTFFNGAALNSWDFFADGVSSGADMNFNFDASAGSFRSGGFSNSDDGQQWNTNTFGDGCGGHAGFIMGNAAQAICEGGATLGGIQASQSTLTATIAPNPVPLPASALLLVAALGAIGVLRPRSI